MKHALKIVVRTLEGSRALEKPKRESATVLKMILDK
jgi:hypothetical protein